MRTGWVSVVRGHRAGTGSRVHRWAVAGRVLVSTKFF